jgi:hypothetical protein
MAENPLDITSFVLVLKFHSIPHIHKLHEINKNKTALRSNLSSKLMSRSRTKEEEEEEEEEGTLLLEPFAVP